MTLRSFVRENREYIDEIINQVVFRYDGNGGPGVVPDPPPTRNDDEREQWISNDEGLYDWARSSGVRM